MKEPVERGRRRGREGVLRKGSGGKRFDGGDGSAGRIGDVQGDRLGPGPGQTDAQYRRPHGMYTDPGPGERQDRRRIVLHHARQQRVQGGVQHGWVDTEQGCLGVEFIVKCDLGEHRAAGRALPGAP
ncbi:hypothetical protein MOV08_00230 [Streptomyces yunnanensis]|uniref:Uncharacterized protein n=1 Tax=Streptomyces yunnanensis TaxID=156453 RepID=A0ABY8AM37_9ACTN|nr:hypothetical protein [Streptomyces yunnanensis]WEB45509.1 hypothetical protein MOV08_43685 [Streptomyces yunnanensis]WEB46118.1 hypothetical protein MOV08_00230 [Streptomyces yunnanensis]